jgi:hypothetical protein
LFHKLIGNIDHGEFYWISHFGADFMCGAEKALAVPKTVKALKKALIPLFRINKNRNLY